VSCERCELRGAPCALCYADGAAPAASPYLRSVFGHKIDLLHPENTPIDVVEIGCALSRICRFGGHLRKGLYWSVASHSVLVSLLVPHELALAGLLHDASEAYLGSDIPRPLKQLIPEYRRIENRWHRRVQDAFGITLRPGDVAEIKAADDQAYAIEKRDLMSPAQYEIGADDRDEIKASPVWSAISEEHETARIRFVCRAFQLGVLPGPQGEESGS
jgi:hypothetical protein